MKYSVPVIRNLQVVIRHSAETMMTAIPYVVNMRWKKLNFSSKRIVLPIVIFVAHK